MEYTDFLLLSTVYLEIVNLIFSARERMTYLPPTYIHIFTYNATVAETLGAIAATPVLPLC
jgi:hypothetical protein